MPLIDAHFWSDRIRYILQRYSEPLLRHVTGRLLKPRSQWPAEELIERSIAALGNAAVIDRRLKDLEPVGRRLLALIGHSRQPCWHVASLLELLAALGHAEGARPILALCEDGLLFPDFSDGLPPVGDFEQWLGQASPAGLKVCAHPDVTARTLGEDLGLPELPTISTVTGVQDADGLEWLLRLAVLWQQVTADPLRLTQQGGFFKRDLDRLQADGVLNGSQAGSPAELPDAGLLAVSLALVEGVVCKGEGELRGGTLPAAWEQGLMPALQSLWAALPHLDGWNPGRGAADNGMAANPYPAAYLLALLLLGRVPESAWIPVAAIERWVSAHHPFWADAGVPQPFAATATPGPANGPALTPFLLGFAFSVRLVEAARDPSGEWAIRLSATGRWLLGLAAQPAEAPSYPKTLLVQPNLEIVAYRQGLTPRLIASLSQLAAWKSLGAACTLQLQPDTVYRALESGWSLESILQALERHGMHATPPAVVESLRTWANKRDRLSVYPAAALFEFASAAELSEALARGLPATRLSDRLAVVANESLIDYRHFRLTATRDYALPPDQCVEVETDGVTLTIDLARADLLLETELRRFAELLDRPGVNGRRQYRLTPASLAAGRESGLAVRALEDWFVQRTGRPLSAAARLLLMGAQTPPLEMRRELVLHVGSAEVADGLLQWPATRALIQGRLGPTALTVAEEYLEQLRERLRGLGITVQLE
jgi:hypothetical protein